jgi:hypothetical protein
MNIIRKAKEFKFIAYQLFSPLAYLRIKHPDKWIYDWLFPVLLMFVSVFIATRFMTIDALVSDSGLLNSIVDFVANLPGFFIAALAAVATFNKHDIDHIMDKPPRIDIVYQGEMQEVDMTRRRFLCVLFSFLTAISIFLVLFTKIALAASLDTVYQDTLAWMGVALFFFALWQMVIATVLGLYYLGERLHTPQ